MSKPVPVIPTTADWPSCTVGELTSLLRRGTAPVYVDDSPVMAIGQRCVTDADFDGTRARPHSAAAMSSVVTPETGDVLINSTGTGTIGRSIVYREDGNRYMVDGHVTVARPCKDGLVARWLNDILRSPEGQRYLESRCYAGSTNQIELSLSALADMPIAVPSIPEQRQIAEILDALDDRIRRTEAIIEKLNVVRQGIVSDLVDRADQSRQSLMRVADLVVPGQFGSAIGPFGSNLMACDYRTSGIPVIFVRDIQSGRFIWKSSVYLSRRKALELNAHRTDPGDVLITKMGDPPGVAAVHPAGFPSAVITADIIRIRPQQQLAIPEWLALYINSSHVARQVRRFAAGVTRQKLTLSDFRNLTVLLPTISDQLLTVKRVTAIDRALSAEEEGFKKVRAAKAGLLADLLSGRIRIPAAGAS